MIIYPHQALGPFTHTKYAILVAVYWSSMDHEQKKKKGKGHYDLGTGYNVTTLDKCRNLKLTDRRGERGRLGW